MFSHLVISDSLRPHGLQHTRLLCPSPSPGVCSNSCPSSRWCHPNISSPAVPFSCLQSFPESGSFPMSWLFASGDEKIHKVLEFQCMSIKTKGIKSWKSKWGDARRCSSVNKWDYHLEGGPPVSHSLMFVKRNVIRDVAPSVETSLMRGREPQGPIQSCPILFVLKVLRKILHDETKWEAGCTMRLHALFFVYFVCCTWSLFRHAGSFNYSMWELVPWPGIEPVPPALGVQSLSCWTTRKVSPCLALNSVGIHEIADIWQVLT